MSLQRQIALLPDSKFIGRALEPMGLFFSATVGAGKESTLL